MLELKKRLLSFISKKNFAFLVATVLLWMGKISDQVWVLVFGVFVGLNAYEKSKGLKYKEGMDGKDGQ